MGLPRMGLPHFPALKWYQLKPYWYHLFSKMMSNGITWHHMRKQTRQAHLHVVSIDTNMIPN